MLTHNILFDKQKSSGKLDDRTPGQQDFLEDLDLMFLFHNLTL